MVCRHLVDNQKIAVRYIGRESADSRSIYRSRFLSLCIVFSPLAIAVEKKLEQDYWNMNRLAPLTRGDSRKIRIFGHFSVSYESKLLKIKHERMPFFAIASRFRVFCFFSRCVYIQNQGFYSLEDNTTQLLVYETKWTGLWSRAGTSIRKIAILKSFLRHEKLPGLSRNGPQAPKILIVKRGLPESFTVKVALVE